MTDYQTFDDAVLLSGEYATADALEIMLRKDGIPTEYINELKKCADQAYGSESYSAHILFSSYVQSSATWRVLNE